MSHDDGGTTLSGDEQDALAQIEFDNMNAEIRGLRAKKHALDEKAVELEGQLAETRARREQAEARLQEVQAQEPVPDTRTAEERDADLQAERTRCVELYALACTHHAPTALLSDAVRRGLSPGDFAMAILSNRGEGHG